VVQSEVNSMAKRPTSSLKIAKVTWIDAEEIGDVGWNSLTEAKKKAKTPCPTMISVGHVLYEGKDHISLISTLGEKECSSLEKLPLSFVVKIERLEVKKDA
jgi:hypothetical protein